MQPTPKSISIIVYGIDGILQKLQSKSDRSPTIRDFLAITAEPSPKNNLIKENVFRYGKQVVSEKGMINMPMNKSFINASNAVNNVIPVCLMNKGAVDNEQIAKDVIKQSIKDGFLAISQAKAGKTVLDGLEELMRKNVTQAFSESPEVWEALLADAEQEYCVSVKNDIMDNWLGNNASDAANDLSV